MEQNYWEAEDKKYIWHPAMQMKDNEVFPPVVIDHAKGSYLYGTDGKEYLDIISSWWCNLLGHCNEEINEALKKQVDELEHVIFTNFSHKPAVKLAQELEKAGAHIIAVKDMAGLLKPDEGSARVLGLDPMRDRADLLPRIRVFNKIDFVGDEAAQAACAADAVASAAGMSLAPLFWCAGSQGK